MEAHSCRNNMCHVPQAEVAPPDFATLSDPARSTRCSLERRTTSLPACRASSMMVKMQWLRVEAWFMGVSDTVRLVSPRNSYSSAQQRAADKV